jgi:hypothetical protein
MSLKDAFDDIKKANAQETRLSGTQAPKRPAASATSGKVKGVAEPRPQIPLMGTAKSRHPDYEAKKVYLRKDTAKEAARKYEDEMAGDFSDLVQILLERYLRS